MEDIRILFSTVIQSYKYPVLKILDPVFSLAVDNRTQESLVVEFSKYLLPWPFLNKNSLCQFTAP